MSEERKITVQMNGTYGGHSVTSAGAIKLKLKFPYDELPNQVKALQLLNTNIDVTAKAVGEDEVSLGSFTYNGMKVSSDGTTALDINSILDNVEGDKINELSYYENGTVIRFTLTAYVDVEEYDEEDDHDDEWDDSDDDDDWKDEDTDSWDDDDENNNDGWD